MADRFCEECEQPYKARRSDQRFCTARCRKRAERRRVASMTDQDDELVADVERDRGQLEVSTFIELDKANALRSSSGQLALMAARRLDLGIPEPGSSIAALMRAHLIAMGQALGNAVPATEDEVDKARRRRAESRSRSARDH